MSKPRYQRGHTADSAAKGEHHRKSGRRHRKNPCGHSPAAPINLFGEFFKHPGHRRHNRWQARLRWQEVRTDIDGLPVVVRTYKVVVVYSATATEDYSPETEADWFVHQRFSVPGRDDDEDANSTAALKVTRGIHGKLAYAYKVKAIEVNGCPSEYAYYTLGPPNDVPPAPSDCKISRASHGIRLRWRAPPDPSDDAVFVEDVDHFIAELWVNEDFGPSLAFTANAGSNVFTTDGAHGASDGDPLMLRNTPGGPLDGPLDMPEGVLPYRMYFMANTTSDTFKLTREEDGNPIDISTNGSGEAMIGMVRHARHIHHKHHIFRLDADDFDEDFHFFGRVCSVSGDRSKSAFMPATAPLPNDDPEATPTGRRPAYHRRVFTFTIPGALSVGTYAPPDRAEDDYRVQRVTGAADGVGSGGDSHIDILVKSGATYDSMFDDTEADMLRFAAGDDDGSTKAMTIRDINRGDKLKVKGFSIDGTPPSDITVHVICDRRKTDT